MKNTPKAFLASLLICGPANIFGQTGWDGYWTAASEYYSEYWEGGYANLGDTYEQYWHADFFHYDTYYNTVGTTTITPSTAESRYNWYEAYYNNWC